MLKYEGKKSKKQEKIEKYGGKLITCKQCKKVYEVEEIKFEAIKIKGKSFYECTCNYKISLK